MLTLPIKGQDDLPLSERVINGSLKQIGCDDKEKGGQGVSLSNTTFANKLSAWDTIKKDRGFPSGEYVFDPRQPFAIKSHLFHNLKHSPVLNCIKGFSEVKLEKHDFFLGGLTLMYILKGPSKTVLYSSTLNETILITMNYF